MPLDVLSLFLDGRTRHHPAGGGDLPKSVCRCRETICSARRKAFGRPVIVPRRLNTPPPGGWWRPSKKCLSVWGDHLISSTQGLWASCHCSQTVEHAAARRVVVPFRKCFAGFGDTVQLIEQTVLRFRQQAHKHPHRADVFVAFVRSGGIDLRQCN